MLFAAVEERARLNAGTGFCKIKKKSITDIVFYFMITVNFGVCCNALLVTGCKLFTRELDYKTIWLIQATRPFNLSLLLLNSVSVTPFKTVVVSKAVVAFTANKGTD